MGGTIDEKIAGFIGYVSIRQLGIAEFLANEFKDEGREGVLKESGYAILSIVMSYFEMIEQVTTGTVNTKGDGAFFARGFRKVYPSAPYSDPDIMKWIYGLVRCSLYHSAMTKGAVPLSRHFEVGFRIHRDKLEINPALVVSEIRLHFDRYAQQLRNPCECDCRCSFEAAYDQISRQWLSSDGLTTANPHDCFSNTPTTANPQDHLPKF